MTLKEKLAAFDAEAVQAYHALLANLGHRMPELVALARARHVWGHEVYGDGLLFELTETELGDERDQELADAVVYEMVRRRGGAPMLAGLAFGTTTREEEGPNGL